MAGKAATITNPATGAAVAEVSMGERADAILALEAAARALPEWSRVDPRERGDLLRLGAEAVRDGIEEIARLLTAEQGKPLRFARREVESSAEALDYYAGEGERISGEVVPVSRASRSLVIRQPLGVAAIISPWNYPADLLAWKLAPALAASCTVVAKPSSHTPLAATRFVVALAEAGLPRGPQPRPRFGAGSRQRAGGELHPPEGLLNRVDGYGEVDYGAGGSDPQAAIPGAGGQLSRNRLRGRRNR